MFSFKLLLFTFQLLWTAEIDSANLHFVLGVNTTLLRETLIHLTVEVLLCSFRENRKSFSSFNSEGLLGFAF